MGLAVARFINGFAGAEIVETYWKAFKPSREMPARKRCWQFQFCVRIRKRKQPRLRKLADYTLLQFEKGNFREMNSYSRILRIMFFLMQNWKGFSITGVVLFQERQTGVRTELVSLAA